MASASEGHANVEALRRDGSLSSNLDGSIYGSETLELILDWLVRRIESTKLTGQQRRIMEFLDSVTVQLCLGVVICLNMCMLVTETDTIAVENSLPLWMVVANRLLLGIYIVELAARLYASSLHFFLSVFNLVDLTVVAVDLFLEIYTFSTNNATPSLTILRVLRLARLARAHKIMKMLPMLSGMVRDLVGAFEAIVWGSVLLGLFTTGWCILGVQFIHPVLVEVVNETNVFEDCERCPRAFSSVWQAFLTLFQTTISGDSWGMLALPLIEHAWWTSIFFIGTVFTLNLAIMNVILAVVVEKADETRKNDLQAIMKLREQELIKKERKLLRVCEDLDEDGSGDLSLDELLRGFDTNKSFAAQFHDLGIDREDMKVMFLLMDSDGSGTVDYREFVQHIRKMKASDEKTILNLIRHNVAETLNNTRKIIQTDAPTDTKHVRENIGPSAETTDTTLNLFEESAPPASHEFVREVTYHAKEFRGIPHREDLIFTQLQRNSNELLQRMSENLDRAFKDMAATSESNLETLHSIKKLMAASLPNRDVERRAISNAPLREPPRPGSVSALPLQRRNIAEAISSCCSTDHTSRDGTAVV